MATSRLAANVETSSYKWVALTLLWFVALLNYVDRQVIFSQFPLIQRDLHATPTELGLISSSFLWVYAVLSPFAGLLADRFGRARSILASLAVWSLATYITAHVHSIESMIASRVLMGVSEAFYLPAALALLVDLHGPDTRSFAVGIHQSGLYTGIIVGGAWGGWMGETYGWRSAFMVLGMAGVVYAVLLFFLLRRDTPGNHRRISVPEFSTVMRSPGFLLLATAFAAASVANWLIYTWLPLLLTERFHLTLAQAGFTATFYIQVASYAGMLAIGFLSDRLALRWGRARVWVQIAGLLLSAPFLLILSRTNSYVLVIPVLLMIGIFRPFFDVNAMPVLRQLVPGNLSSTGYGILNMVGCFGGGIAALAAGYFKNTAGLAAAYQWAAIVLIAGAVPLIMLSRNRLSDQ